jgi:hypothetical protein
LILHALLYEIITRNCCLQQNMQMHSLCITPRCSSSEVQTPLLMFAKKKIVIICTRRRLFCATFTAICVSVFFANYIYLKMDKKGNSGK